MSTGTYYEPKQRELVPGGKYLFIVRNVEAVPNPFAKEGQDDKQIRLTLELEKEAGVPIRDSDGSPHTQWAFMGRILGHSKEGTPYKSQAWSEAILCQKLNAREPFDFGDLLDHRGWINILGFEKDGVTPANRIDTIMPLGPIVGPAYNENKSQAVVDERTLLMDFSKAKMALIDAGVKLETINTRIKSLTGSLLPFDKQAPDMQTTIVEWLSGWAADLQALATAQAAGQPYLRQYDDTGDIAM